MLKKGLFITGMAFLLVFSLNLTACKNFKGFNSNKIPEINYNRSYPKDIERYRNAESYYMNIRVTTNDVMNKATKYKAILMQQIPGAEMESFNINEDSSNLRLRVPIDSSEKINEIFSQDPEITEFSKSTNQIGSSYIEMAANYYTVKALYDNIDAVIELIQRKSSYPVDSMRLRKMFEDQLRSNEYSLKDYEKQFNRMEVQVYFAKKGG